MVRKNGYTYEEVRFILNSYKTQSVGQVRISLKDELDSARTSGAIIAVYNLFRHFKLDDNTYISPTMRGFLRNMFPKRMVVK